MIGPGSDKNAKITDHHNCVLIIEVLNQNLILKSALFLEISKELRQREENTRHVLGFAV